MAALSPAEQALAAKFKALEAKRKVNAPPHSSCPRDCMHGPMHLCDFTGGEAIKGLNLQHHAPMLPCMQQEEALKAASGASSHAAGSRPSSMQAGGARPGAKKPSLPAFLDPLSSTGLRLTPLSGSSGTAVTGTAGPSPLLQRAEPRPAPSLPPEPRFQPVSQPQPSPSAPIAQAGAAQGVAQGGGGGGVGSDGLTARERAIRVSVVWGTRSRV